MGNEGLYTRILVDLCASQKSMGESEIESGQSLLNDTVWFISRLQENALGFFSGFLPLTPPLHRAKPAGVEPGLSG